jgi:GLPGLI family protein
MTFLKTTVLVLFISMFSVNTFARIIIEEDSLDNCLIEVLYERIKVTDTLDIQNKYITNNLTLRAGKNASAFYSAARKNYDSISCRNFEITLALFNDKDAFRRMSNEEWETIFKLKNERKTIVNDRFDMTAWHYEEELEAPSWCITDSLKEINGLQCIKAVTSFRGREWIAWFSPDIPLNEGPWKLWGLPGLIVKAYDTKGHYMYFAKSIDLTPIGYVSFFNYVDRVKTSRLKALNVKRKALQESIAQKIKESGAFGISTAPSMKTTSKLENRNYDFEETDYPHN